MKKLTKLTTQKIINEWYALNDFDEIYEKNDIDLIVTNDVIEPVRNIINTMPLDLVRNQFEALYVTYKDEHKLIMDKLVNNDVAFNSINSLFLKNTTSGKPMESLDLIIDLARIAFSNTFQSRDVEITESEKKRIISNVHERHKDYISALSKIDYYAGSSQVDLQEKLYRYGPSRVLELWAARKKTVSRTSNKNSRRLDMFGQFAIYFNDKFGTPHWSDVLSITSAFYDCDDTSPENIRITLSKKLGLTRNKP
jgi:hypothetical protein